MKHLKHHTIQIIKYEIYRQIFIIFNCHMDPKYTWSEPFDSILKQ